MKKKLKFENLGDGVHIIETYYLNRLNFTACYLLEDQGELAIIETNTNHAVPYILEAINHLGFQKDQVKYVILTHIHLDHAGGTGELLRQLPSANLIVHPRGRKHMINPEKLIQSVKSVYGEDKYKELYGEIIPIPAKRVITANDEDEFKVGNRILKMFDMRGHAKHHLVIWDKKYRNLFSGDNFGIAYPKLKFGNTRMVFPSTSPTQFEPEHALSTYERILHLEPSRILLTHYGVLENIKDAYQQLKAWIEFSTKSAEKRYNQGYREEELTNVLKEDILEQFYILIKENCSKNLTIEEQEWLAMDVELNAQGLTHYISKLNSQESH